MKIAIPNDYQDVVRTLDCFQKLNGQHVVITCEHLSDSKVLAALCWLLRISVPTRALILARPVLFLSKRRTRYMA